MSDLMPLTGNALAVFQTDLMKDEKILWSGQPEPKLLCKKDLFLIPFGLFFFCFSIFWILGASGFLSGAHQLSAFGLFGIPFVLVGAYTLFGRFFVKSWKQKNTYYAVTDQRILILCTAPSRSLQTVYINTLPALNKSIGSEGVGTIEFGNTSPRAAMYANSGMEFMGGMLAAEPAFYDIKNVNSVYELINNQRKK